MLRFANLGAVTGSALIVLALVVTTTQPATTLPLPSRQAETALTIRYSLVRTLWKKANYASAGALAVSIANDAEKANNYDFAAKAWMAAGLAYLVDLRLKDALVSFTKELKFAKLSGSADSILASYTSLSSLYLQLGDPASASHYAMLGLAAPPANSDIRKIAALRLLLARSTAKLKPFSEALPIYREALALHAQVDTEEGLQMAITAWDLFGGDAMQAGQLDVAETALNHAMYLATMHKGHDLTNILRKLAKLKDRQGDLRSATALYKSAEAAPPDLTPRWLLYADRGDFRLAHQDNAGALEDFQKARSLVKQFRSDVVPNDQGRVHLESGLSRVSDGFIEAGNRAHLFEETFEVAEQSRSFNLAALTPAADDWRSHLPSTYWDLLNRYRVLTGAPASSQEAESVQLQLSQMEAAASGQPSGAVEFALPHVKSVLGPRDAFFSFHTGERSSWLWVITGSNVQVVALPPRKELESAVQRFRKSVRTSAGFEQEGSQLYQTMFGKISGRALTASRWIIALDGPLFDLPLAALVLPQSLPGKPVYLCEKVALQLAPGALLLRKGRSLLGGSFVGIADPIYNAADPRYRGRNTTDATLPRLPASRRELTTLAKEWGSDRSTLLFGSDTSLQNVFSSLQKAPAILHFATHVVSGTGEYRSGLIALGLRQDGHMDLLGPMEIVSRRVEAELVVLNGCQSGQAQAVPGSGLMGLTRAWIASGANAVLATQWDVADEDSQALMLNFYRGIKEKSDENIAFALQRAWIKLLQNKETRYQPSTWAAYFLLART